MQFEISTTLNRTIFPETEYDDASNLHRVIAQHISINFDDDFKQKTSSCNKGYNEGKNLLRDITCSFVRRDKSKGLAIKVPDSCDESS